MSRCKLEKNVVGLTKCDFEYEIFVPSLDLERHDVSSTFFGELSTEFVDVVDFRVEYVRNDIFSFDASCQPFPGTLATNYRWEAGSSPSAPKANLSPSVL